MVRRFVFSLFLISSLMVIGCGISGTVGDAGVGVEGVTVTLSGAASGTVDTGADGTYSFTDLMPGNYTVTVSPKCGYDMSSVSQSVDIAKLITGGKDVDFEATDFTAGALEVEADGLGAYADIKAAITAAVSGDTIVLYEGTYTGANNRELDYGGKAITIRSYCGDPASCIIDCESATYGRGFYFHNGEGNDSVLSGVTITNGNRNLGAGIYCYGASPTIENCIISNCNVTLSGAGMYIQNSTTADADPVLNNCTFDNNTAGAHGGAMVINTGAAPVLTSCTFSNNLCNACGGAIWCTGASSPTLTDCTFEGNEVQVTGSCGGGGMFIGAGSTATLTGCTFDSNTVNLAGGGLYIHIGSVTELEGCTFKNNNSDFLGGGMFFWGASDGTTINSCIFEGNTATHGGGILNTGDSTDGYTDLTLVNSVFSGNTATGDGGGLINEGDSTVTNCTFIDNLAATSRGGGMLNGISTSTTVTNCIFWGNSSQIDDDSAAPAVAYSDVEGGYGDPADNNIDSDPLLDATYHLTASSTACIDTGNNAAVAGIDYDFEGDARIKNGTVDMGADEY